MRFHLRFHNSQHHAHPLAEKLARMRNTGVGFGVCAASALAVSILLRNLPFIDSMPFAFLALVALVAHRFGTRGAIFGLLGGAFIFATLLYAPVGSVSITNTPERTNVVLMLLFGLAVAYFYGATKPDDGAHDPKS